MIHRGARGGVGVAPERNGANRVRALSDPKKEKRRKKNKRKEEKKRGRERAGE